MRDQMGVFLVPCPLWITGRSFCIIVNLGAATLGEAVSQRVYLLELCIPFTSSTSQPSGLQPGRCIQSRVEWFLWTIMSGDLCTYELTLKRSCCLIWAVEEWASIGLLSCYINELLAYRRTPRCIWLDELTWLISINETLLSIMIIVLIEIEIV